jgi:ferredoxin-NADP reductase/MOSC domain-containing protein YiiM
LKLVSVNVGLPREVQWQGRLVRTAIWKRSVTGRVVARRLNIDGDRQADLHGHGGEQRAVMVYQLDSYRHWAAHLGRNDFEHGQFGENLTVEGLADDEVCIGDRYRIGSAVFEVSQPRVTCYRVGIRMNEPRMPALLVTHKRPGFYFRVIQEGEIGAGDAIEKVADGPECLSVADTDALLYLPSPSREALERAARIPALSPGWKGSVAAMLAPNESGARAPAWPGFRALKVVEVRPEAKDVTSFVLAAEPRSTLPTALPGQFIVLRLQPKHVLRSYSISGPPDGGTYRITVKRTESHVLDGVRVGDALEVSAPRGEFTLAPGSLPIVLISAGIGITPVLSMLHSISAGAANGRSVWWFYGARNSAEHPFAAETRHLLASLPNAHSYVLYSRPGPDDRAGQHFDAEGRVDVATLQRLGVPQRAEFYLCGPAGFLTELTGALRSWGVEPAHIHREIFGPEISPAAGVGKAPHPPAGAAGSGPSVSFSRSGLTVPWNARHKSLLEFAEACEVPVKWSCRTGVCHNCESALLDGSVRYEPDPLVEPAAGNVLICCSTPQSEIDLDL